MKPTVSTYKENFLVKFEFVGKGKQFEKYLTKNQEQTTEFELEEFNF